MTIAAAGPLALVGGDELSPGNEPHDEVLASASGDGPAYVLATAAARQRPDLAVANAKRWFARLGLEIRELPATKRSDVTSETNVELARSGRFFYLVGGDPGLVPKLLAGTPLWSAMVEAWRSGAALAGSSAGAMALGEWTLIRDRFPGDRKRWYREALGVVQNIAVIPHFDTFGSRWVESALLARPRDGAVLVGVDERSAAIWHEGVWRASGPGCVTVLSNGEVHRFEPGDQIEGVLPDPGGRPAA